MVFSLPVFSQGYFSPVQPTGLPYIVVINQVMINGLPAAPGTEIAVYDDTLCVGVTTLLDSINNSIVAWQGNPSVSLPGFTAGDSMIFLGYIPSLNKVIRFTSVTITGDGTFGSGSFSAVTLNYNEVSAIRETGLGEGSSGIRVYPNPNNGNFNIRIKSPKRGTGSLKIFTLLGELPWEEKIELNNEIMEFPIDTESRLPAGEYLLRLDLAGSSFFGKIIIIR